MLIGAVEKTDQDISTLWTSRSTLINDEFKLRMDITTLFYVYFPWRILSPTTGPQTIHRSRIIVQACSSCLAQRNPPARAIRASSARRANLACTNHQDRPTSKTSTLHAITKLKIVSFSRPSQSNFVRITRFTNAPLLTSLHHWVLKPTESEQMP